MPITKLVHKHFDSVKNFKKWIESNKYPAESVLMCSDKTGLPLAAYCPHYKTIVTRRALRSGKRFPWITEGQPAFRMLESSVLYGA